MLRARSFLCLKNDFVRNACREAAVGPVLIWQRGGVKLAREVCSYLGIFYKIAGLLPAVRRRKQILPMFTEESSL